jgi:hypothetical protein
MGFGILDLVLLFALIKQVTGTTIMSKPMSQVGSVQNQHVLLPIRTNLKRGKQLPMVLLPSSRSALGVAVGVEDWCRLGTTAITAPGTFSSCNQSTVSRVFFVVIGRREGEFF